MKISRELYQEMQNQTAPKTKVITLFQWLFSSVDSSAPSVNYCCTSMHSSVLIKLLRLPLLPLPLSVAACSSPVWAGMKKSQNMPEPEHLFPSQDSPMLLAAVPLNPVQRAGFWALVQKSLRLPGLSLSMEQLPACSMD
mgnify:CR=1 FL=1